MASAAEIHKGDRTQPARIENGLAPLLGLFLIHQGHVIEFANGMLETAKKPLPKPPPKPAPAAPQADAAKGEPTLGESAVNVVTEPAVSVESTTAAAEDDVTSAVEPERPPCEEPVASDQPAPADQTAPASQIT